MGNRRAGVTCRCWLARLGKSLAVLIVAAAAAVSACAEEPGRRPSSLRHEPAPEARSQSFVSLSRRLFRPGELLCWHSLERPASCLPVKPLEATTLLVGVEQPRKLYADVPAALAQSASTTASAPPSRKPEGIADNSFLLEEAYNQGYAVVQHISVFQKNVRRDGWSYDFTQEWPINPSPKHQFSFTLPFVAPSSSPGQGGGFGDILLNWRYQLVGNEDADVAFSPRVSLILPSGNSDRGRGAGHVGVDFNLPLSWVVHPKLVTHWNAGGTIIPNAKDPSGNRATTSAVTLAQSFIWIANPRFQPLLETIFTRAEGITGPSQTQWENSVTLNPGFRWAYNFESGLQIVPGISFPVEVARNGRGNWQVLLYLSFEHPFGRRSP